MSFIGGYQSDVNLNNINFVGDFPIGHSIGGFGITTGMNNYVLHLTPSILEYRQGLALGVRFSQANTTSVTINVDGRGIINVKKIVAGTLANLEAGDLANDKIYILIYDGTFFQVANSSHMLLEATETRQGISQIATIEEVEDGEDDTKIVTPAKLAVYIADKITGLWEDKGVLNCAGNPDFPAGEVGDAYTVSAPGKIGGVLGQNVTVRDVVYCNIDNPGGEQEGVGYAWTVIQANLEPATELIAGYARIAVQAEVNAGVSNSTIVTPLKLMSLLNVLLKYQAGAGVNSIIPKLGVNNTAPGSHAAVLNGSNNRANNTFSQALGSFADAWQFNEYAKAPGAFFAIPGSVQHSVLTLWNIVPSGGGVYPINLDGNGTSTLNRWRIPTNSIIQFMLQFSIVQNSGSSGTIGDTWTAIYEGVAKNVGDVISWVGGTPTAREIRQNAGFSPAIIFGISGNEIIPNVVAINNRNLFVNITAYITQTKFNL